MARVQGRAPGQENRNPPPPEGHSDLAASPADREVTQRPGDGIQRGPSRRRGKSSEEVLGEEAVREKCQNALRLDDDTFPSTAEPIFLCFGERPAFGCCFPQQVPRLPKWVYGRVAEPSPAGEGARRADEVLVCRP